MSSRRSAKKALLTQNDTHALFTNAVDVDAWDHESLKFQTEESGLFVRKKI